MNSGQMVIAEGSVPKLLMFISAYDEAIASGDKMANIGGAELRALCDEVGPELDIECRVFPRTAKKQLEAGTLKMAGTGDGRLRWYQRSKAPKQYVDVPAMERARPVLEMAEASITPPEMHLYAGRHFKDGRSRRARNGRDDAILRVTEKVEKFTTTH
jgi:hypothetical protein